MSFQAKSTIVMLTALIVSYGWYGLQVFRLAADNSVDMVKYQPLVLIVVVPLVAIATIGQIVISALNPSEADSSDERDREIARRGSVIGGWIVSVAAIGVLFAAMAEVSHFWIFHLLLAGLVLAEVIDWTWRLVLYRRGI
jgi:hypothetical protein